jgi:hypothetical protein
MVVDGQIRAIAVLVLVVLVLGGGACGGSSSQTSGPPVLGAAFQKKALAVCHAIAAEKQAQGPFPYPDFNPTQPDPADFPRIAQYEVETVKRFTTWQREMRALGQPPSGQAAWAALVRTVNSHVHVIIDQQAAAQRGDSEAFTKTYQEGSKATADELRAADNAGIPGCAVDR